MVDQELRLMVLVKKDGIIVGRFVAGEVVLLATVGQVVYQSLYVIKDTSIMWEPVLQATELHSI